MTAVMTRPEPHVEQDEYSQAPADFPPETQPNGESHDEVTEEGSPEKPQISIAEALAKNAANRQKLIDLALATISEHEKAKAAFIAEIDFKIANLRTQIGEPVKTRKPRTPKQAPVETVSPKLAEAIAGPKRRGRPAKGDAPARKPSKADDPVSLMKIDTAYTVSQAKALFDGAKPGEVLAEAMQSGIVVKGGGAGLAGTYTRIK
jgi:hypothetical protein